QAEDGIRDRNVTGVQTCALPISVTFVVVERLLVNTSDGAAAVEHQVFADQAAGVRKTIRKLLVRGKQEQAGRFSPVRANRYGLCPLQMRVARTGQKRPASSCFPRTSNFRMVLRTPAA